MKKLNHLSVRELLSGYKAKEFSPEEVTKAYLEEISSEDGRIGAYITVLENALKPTCTDKNAPLYGVPYSLKDNIITKDIRTTCASEMLSDFIPPFSSSVYEKLTETGGILIGKTNMDEFAMGSSTENSAIKITRNPLNTEYVPGGSSGGSAASVAAFEAAFSLGTDTGGSVCQPASFCGITGLNATYGLVSRYGLIGFAPGFDRIGTLTRNVYDSALVLSQIAFHDSKDSTSVYREQKDYTQGIENGVKGMRVGIISEFLNDGADRRITDTVRRAATTLERLGAYVDEISLPILSHSASCYLVLSSSEAYSTLSRYDGLRYGFSPDGTFSLTDLYIKTRSRGFGDEVKRRLLSGSVFLSNECFEKYYRRAEKVRSLICESYRKAFESYDILISPVTPGFPHKIGEKPESVSERFLSDRYTCCANLAYLPSLSLPFGKADNGFSTSVLLTAKAFGEDTLLRTGYALEKALGGAEE